MTDARRVRPAEATPVNRRLSNTAGLALAIGVGSALWGGLAEAAHLLGAF